MRHPAAAIADRLMQEHEAGIEFQAFAAAEGITDPAAAYEVQRHLVDLLKERSGEAVGYKIGLTSLRMQRMCGIDTPIAGVVLAGRVHENGVAVRLQDYCRLGLEFEIGVRVGRDLVQGSAPHTPDSISGAVSAVCAAIEMVDDRNADYGNLDALSLIADNSWNAGVVLGGWHETWPSLTDVQARVHQDGSEIDRGLGSDALGHPFAPLAWLANHLNQQGENLRAGDVVLTGSLVVTRFPEKTHVYRHDMGDIGFVEVTVVA